MTNKKVLVIGGYGRIGHSVAQDIVDHTDAQVTITSRKTQPQDKSFESLVLDLNNLSQLQRAIADQDLVVHCAGPISSP